MVESTHQSKVIMVSCNAELELTTIFVIMNPVGQITTVILLTVAWGNDPHQDLRKGAVASSAVHIKCLFLNGDNTVVSQNTLKKG